MTTPVTKKRVAIIGAGFTGLAAGYRLAQKGHEVVIFEKSSDIGGLAGGFTIEGAPLEKAYHHLFKTDTSILSIAKELEAPLEWFESKVGMAVKNNRNSFDLFPFNGAKDLLFYKPLPFLDRVRAGAVLFFLQKFKNWRTLANKTAKEWMTTWSGKQVMAKIWGPLLQGKFAEYSSKVSMAWLWARIHIRANSRKSIFEKELLAYPKGGFLSIAITLAEKIAALVGKPTDDVVRKSSTISTIEYEGKDIWVTSQKGKEQFDALLSTIPYQAFHSLLAKPSEANTPNIEYLGAVVLAFSSEQSLSRYYWHNIIDQDSPFLVFLQHTNLVPSEWYNNQHVYYIGVYVPQSHRYLDKSTSKEEIQTEWFNYLEKIFPAFDRTKIREQQLFTFSHAQHVVDTNYESKIPPYKTDFPNTYTANFAQIFPEDRGTNYAIREGEKIAAAIDTDLLQ
ncbi:MAG: FAD-dependent oxidoreductase [Patescibacteria group bacterium]